MRSFVLIAFFFVGCSQPQEADDVQADHTVDVGTAADSEPAQTLDEGSAPDAAPAEDATLSDTSIDQDANAEVDLAPDMSCAPDEDCLRQLPECDLADVERDPGGDGWKDSYSVGNKCYCDTTFDHDIGDIVVDTPVGPKTVREVCEALGPGPGSDGHPIFNDIQCGNGPANDAGDEDWCPGRVDEGRDGCCTAGPRWDFDDAAW